MKYLKHVAGFACLVLAVAWIFQVQIGSDSDTKPGKVGDNHPVNPRRDYQNGRPHTDIQSSPVPQALELPAPPVHEKKLEAIARVSETSASHARPLIPDDDILTRGGVLPDAPKMLVTGDKVKGPRSIKSQDWKGEGNLLVNALRAGDQFEVDHDQLIGFLRGRDLLGWPEGYRNWIGDELMTALRQDMPKSAFEDLKLVEADSTAPAAMRDYSVQHISHLVTGGVIGQEGADYIWKTLEENDPLTLSTALISLHRLSEQVPDLVSAAKVRVAAERLKENPDERTRITAESILKK